MRRNDKARERIVSNAGGLQVLIDGVVVSPDEVGPPAMNYGQLWRWKGRKCVRYEYRMALAEFLGRAEGWFDRYRTELKADDATHLPPTGTDAHAFAALGHPSLSDLLTANPELASRLLLELPLELNNLFAPARPEGIRYVTNTVDRFSLTDGTVHIGGIAFVVDTAAERSSK